MFTLTRRLLISLLGPSALSLMCADEKTPTTEPRLLGKWKSDLGRSMEFNEKHAKLTDSQSAFLRQLLGKMTLHFDAVNCTTEFPAYTLTGPSGKSIHMEESHWTEPYTVLGATDSAVAIKFTIKSTTKTVKLDQLAILHFDGDYLWTYVGDSPWVSMHVREYFRRVK